MALLNGTDPIASWWLAIVVLLVVTVVVAVLLRMVINAAKAVDAEAAEVWARGQRVANNTIHIASLYRTSELVDRILGRAGGIANAATAIKTHAESCPGCPECIWKKV